MGNARVRRRAPKTRTAREENADSCAAHLRDLRRAHGAPPPDVAVPQRSVPLRLSPEPVASYCTSPGHLCAELAG
jgi:hypothetical protein